MGSLTVGTSGTISGVAENTQINTVAVNLATMSQSAAAPTTSSTGLSSTAGLWWHDTTNNLIKVRNQADSAWITVGTINETADTFQASGSSSGTFLATSGGTLTGGLIVQAGGVNIQAGGLTIGAGGASITGGVGITGTLSVSGTVSFASSLSVGAGLTAAGQIVSTSGGFKFPDGSVQTTAVSTSGLVTTSALSSYAPLASPVFSGVPMSPRPSDTQTSNQIATCDWVRGLINAALATFVSTGSTGGGGDTSGY